MVGRWNVRLRQKVLYSIRSKLFSSYLLQEWFRIDQLYYRSLWKSQSKCSNLGWFEILKPKKNDWKKDWHGKFDIFWSPQKNVLHIRHSRYINHQSPSGSFPSSNETLSLCWVLLPCWFFCFTTDTPRGRTVNWCAIFRYLQGWHIEAEFRSRSSCQAWKIQGYSSERYHLDPEDVTTS